MTTTRASRVRKCRHQHQCPLCRGLVLVGQQESLVLSRGWAHTDCVVTAQQATPAEPRRRCAHLNSNCTGCPGQALPGSLYCLGHQRGV